MEAFLSSPKGRDRKNIQLAPRRHRSGHGLQEQRLSFRPSKSSAVRVLFSPSQICIFIADIELRTSSRGRARRGQGLSSLGGLGSEANGQRTKVTFVDRG